RAELGVALDRFYAALPFAPTGAQRRAIAELSAEVAGSPEGSTMSRLLQGDVGSGKTVVALALAQLVVAAGGQVALMAPTELLAEQHARSLQPIAERVGVPIAVLTGSTPAERRATLLAELRQGR